MTRILAFASLLALQFALGTCDEVQILSEGSIMRLKAPDAGENVTQCFITSNQNKTYELFPRNEFPGSYNGRETNCGLDAREIPISYAGVWTMKTITEKENFETKFIIKMQQQTVMRPTNYISASAGHWATVWLDSDRDDLTFCNLTIPKRSDIDLMNDKVENLTRIHGCGVRVLINKNMNAQWTFTAQFGHYLIKTAIFHIRDDREDADRGVIRRVLWEIGQSEKLEIYEMNVPFCQLTRPDGTKVPLIFGSCDYKIPSVSAYHSGVWKASYAEPGKLELKHEEINVTTIDPNFMEISSTPGIGKAVNLLCRSGIRNLQFCSFIRPDKHVINVPAGIGNERYAYYGRGYADKVSMNREYGECGLTIHDPSTEDFGTWTCEMGIGETVRGAVIKVVNTRMARLVSKIVNPKVFVKRGDNFKIRCSADAVLSYCWLTSPNGTTYSVSSAEGSGKSLKYDGKGFTMGECGAIVKNANDTDNGEWTCHLGFDTGAENEATVAVIVTDTYLIAAEDTVYAQPKPTLSCRTILDEEATLRYCRWVRPNGHGINKEEASRYHLKRGMSDCSLTILTLIPEDIGQWQCVASLTRAPGNEERSTVNLKAVDDETSIASVLSIVLGSGLLVIILIGAFFAAMHLYKRRNARLIKNPPPYYAEDYNVPHGVHIGPETSKSNDYVSEQSKDYVY